MSARQRLRRVLDRLSLRAAVVLAVLGGLVGPAFVAALLEMRTAEAEARARLQGDTAILADVLAISMRGPLWQVSPELGRGTAQAMLRDPRVVGVMVRFEDGRPFLDVYRSVNARAENVSERRIVLYEGREIGSVVVTVSTAPMRDELAARRLAMFWRFLGAVVVSLLAILWVLHRWLLQPLHGVAQAAGRLSERRLDEPFDLSRRDELGQLAAALEETRRALRDAFDELESRNRQLKAYADTLEARVEQRTADLTEANARLTQTLVNLRSAQRTLLESEKLASLGRLVAGIAHEMNSPLGNSMTVVTELEERYREFIDRVAAGGVKRSEFDRFLDHSHIGIGILRRNVERASVLITHFRQVAIDQSTERRRSFDLAQVVDETMSTLQHRFKRTPYVLQAELTDSLLMDSYPGPLEQAIINLVENALAYAFQGRSYGTVTVRTDRLNRQRVRLVVRDDGVGMSEDALRHVFEPFYSVRPGDDRPPGTGLGMNIVYSIVTSVLGGRIDVQSRPGEGTAVIIDLPVEAPKFHAAADPGV